MKPTFIDQMHAHRGTVCTAVIQKEIDRMAAAGGGEVRIPSGEWITGTLMLRDRVCLFLERGAVLLGSLDIADYPAFFPHDRVQSRRAFDRRLILADNCTGASLRGQGRIDGRHGCPDSGIPEGERRPLLLQFINCKNLAVSGLSLQNAGSWCQQYLDCEGVRIEGLRVSNHGNFTNDGLDIDGSRDVLMTDCDIDSHDDALVFKSTGPHACKRIEVRDCRLWSNCHPIKFGTESVGGFEDILVRDCHTSPSRVPAPMPGFPQGRPANSGFALECVDGAVMRGIRLENLRIDRVLAPFLIKLGNRHHTRLKGAFDPNAGPGILEDIEVRGIRIREAGPYSASITGYPGHPVKNLRFEDLDIECRGGVRAEQILEKIPENSQSYPEINMFGNKNGKHLPSWGLFLRHVRDLRMKDARWHLTGQDGRVCLFKSENVDAEF
ncbi:MAG: hypothetical protein JJU29_07940 [Verrucomicrobia bacterium]|nr:hypothetical protein [Verrucomicrobiota bacterium]MCH8511944.1 hypothetical protein [Kiritimatiellia bacterium]